MYTGESETMRTGEARGLSVDWHLYGKRLGKMENGTVQPLSPVLKLPGNEGKDDNVGVILCF